MAAAKDASALGTSFWAIRGGGEMYVHTIALRSNFDVHESESRREHATIATTVANMPGSCKTASAVSYSLMYVCVEFYGVIGSTE